MSKFKRLSFLENQERFPLMNEEAQKAIKGGCRLCDDWLDQNPGGKIYTENEFYDHTGEWTGGFVCGIGYMHAEATAYGYTSGDDYCPFHNLEEIYGPFGNECAECYFDGWEDLYGGYDGYGDYWSGDGDSGNSGGGSSGGSSAGGVGDSGGGHIVDLPSTVLDNFDRDREKVSASYTLPTCAFDCVSEVLFMFGDNQTSGDLMLFAALHLNMNLADISSKGVNREQYEALVNHFFDVQNVSNNDFLDFSLSANRPVVGCISTNSNDVMHCVVIIDFDINTGICTYFDPLTPNDYKYTDVDNISHKKSVGEKP